jgi:hypothetical protein
MGVRQHNVPTATMAALPPKALDGEPLEFTATARVKIRILTRIDIGKRLPIASRTTNRPEIFSTVQGGGKRRWANGLIEPRLSLTPTIRPHATGIRAIFFV